MSHHTNLDENLEGADNFRSWKYRISLVLEDFNKLKSHHLAPNSNFLFKMLANFKEKIMEMEYLIQDIMEDLKG